MQIKYISVVYVKIVLYSNTVFYIYLVYITFIKKLSYK